MNRLPILVALLALCGVVASPAAPPASAPGAATPPASKTARGWFNAGAESYADAKDEPALKTVTEGLQAYPDDPPLRKLKELIEKKQQQQKQQDQQQKDQQQQQQKDQQQGNQQNQQQKPDQQKKQDRQHQNASSNGQSSEQRQQPPGEPRKAGEMSKEEAKMLLDALREEERAGREHLKLNIGPPVPVDENW